MLVSGYLKSDDFRCNKITNNNNTDFMGIQSLGPKESKTGSSDLILHFQSNNTVLSRRYLFAILGQIFLHFGVLIFTKIL